MPNLSVAAINTALVAIYPVADTYYGNLTWTDPGQVGNGEMGGGSNARAAFGWTAGSGDLTNTASLSLTVGVVPSNDLGAAVAVGDQTITLATAAGSNGFPQGAYDFALVIDQEWMLVTGGFGTLTLTVTRGYNGTTPTTHADGATITCLACGLGVWSAATGGSYIGGTGILAPSPFTFIPLAVTEGQVVTYASGDLIAQGA